MVDSIAVKSYQNRGEANEICNVLKGVEVNSSVEWSYVGGIRTLNLKSKMRLSPPKRIKRMLWLKLGSIRKMISLVHLKEIKKGK